MNTDSSNTETATSAVPNPYFQIFVLTLATFMATLDATVVTVSLPKMASDLSSTPTEVIWTVSAYIVAMAAILPISGWIATYFGRKNYYMFCVVGFTVTSLLCGLAQSLESLVFFRVLQGLTSGGLASSEQAIIADITPQEKLGRAFSIYAFGVSFAPILGPTLGGFITDTLSWHWIFFINLPIGIVSLILTGLFVKESEAAKEASREFRRSGKAVDWLGIILFVTGIAALVLVLEKGPKEGWFDSDFVLLLAAYSFFALLIGITWEYYHEKPAVDVFILKHRGFTGALILALTAGFVISGTNFLIPFFSQTLLGYTAMDAGMISLPGTIVQLIGIQIVGYLADKFEIRRLILFGLVSMIFSIWYFATLNLDASFYDLSVARTLQLFSLSFLAVTVNTAAYYGLPPEKNNSAAALLNLARNMGMSFGIALTSTLVALRTQTYINNTGYHTTELNPNYTEAVKKIAQSLQEHGLTAAQAAAKAKAMIWERVIEQSTMNAIIDAFMLYIVLHICV
ncbi:MAG TPA: MFS transporter, partial [Pyrinomonadaceae bacterium]|nr:MFS transporter [Pyrinomonadaceae bacterium]